MSFCNLIICSDQKVFAGAKIARNSLKIFPFGVVSLAKEEDGKKAPSASKVLVSIKKGNKYQVMPSKVDLAKEAGAIPLSSGLLQWRMKRMPPWSCMRAPTTC